MNKHQNRFKHFLNSLMIGLNKKEQFFPLHESSLEIFLKAKKLIEENFSLLDLKDVVAYYELNNSNDSEESNTSSETAYSSEFDVFLKWITDYLGTEPIELNSTLTMFLSMNSMKGNKLSLIDLKSFLAYFEGREEN